MPISTASCFFDAKGCDRSTYSGAIYFNGTQSTSFLGLTQAEAYLIEKWMTRNSLVIPIQNQSLL